MNYPHTMRLAGPWDFQVLTTNQADPAAALRGRVRLPADFGETFGAGYRGSLRFVRRFNRPTNLDAGELVWLVIEPSCCTGLAVLNDVLLGDLAGSGPTEFDITSRLELNNVLALEIAFSRSWDKIPIDVRLEIRLAEQATADH